MTDSQTPSKPSRRGFLADLDRAMNGFAYAYLADYLPDRKKRAILGVAEPVCIDIRLPGPTGVSGPSQAPAALAIAAVETGRGSAGPSPQAQG